MEVIRSGPAVAAKTEFIALYHAHFTDLSGQLYAFVGDAGDANDLVQEAFVRAWQHWSTVGTHTDPAGWVRRAAWNLAQNRHRRRLARFRRWVWWRDQEPPQPGPEAVFATARIRARRRRAKVVAAAVVAATGLAAGTAAANNPAGPESDPPAAAPTPDAATAGSRVMGVIPRAQPTGLKLLAPGWLLDIDAGESYPVDVDGWLPRPGKDPLLVEWAGDPGRLSPIEVSSRVEPALPGSPTVVRLNRSAAGSVAANVDGDGLWVLERQSGRCTLREVDLSGQERRPPRTAECDLQLLAGTALGLWVVEEEGRGDSVLLDPDDLAELARYEEAWIIDDYKFLRHPSPWVAFELHDISPGADGGPGAKIAWPDDTYNTRVGAVSPDGQYLPLSYMDEDPRNVEIWVAAINSDGRVSLINTGPEEPGARHKFTHVAWAGDGRLVMLASVANTGYVVTWDRDDGYQAVPFEHPPEVEFEWPELEPKTPIRYPILVLEP